MTSTKKAWLKKTGFSIIKMFNNLRNTFTPSPSPVDTGISFKINEIDIFDNKIDDFWDRIKNNYNFIIGRTNDYLNWRFCDSRGGNYIVKQAEDNGRVLGYIVLRINKYIKEYPIAHIVDLLVLPDYLYVASILLKDAISYFDSQRLNVIFSLVTKGHPYERLFWRHGFLDIRSNYYLVFQLLDHEVDISAIDQPEKVHFQLADTDWI